MRKDKRKVTDSISYSVNLIYVIQRLYIHLPMSSTTLKRIDANKISSHGDTISKPVRSKHTEAHKNISRTRRNQTETVKKTVFRRKDTRRNRGKMALEMAGFSAYKRWQPTHIHKKGLNCISRLETKTSKHLKHQRHSS